jgi:hypothetical protein
MPSRLRACPRPMPSPVPCLPPSHAFHHPMPSTIPCLPPSHACPCSMPAPVPCLPPSHACPRPIPAPVPFLPLSHSCPCPMPALATCLPPPRLMPALPMPARVPCLPRPSLPPSYACLRSMSTCVACPACVYACLPASVPACQPQCLPGTVPIWLCSGSIKFFYKSGRFRILIRILPEHFCGLWISIQFRICISELRILILEGNGGQLLRILPEPEDYFMGSSLVQNSLPKKSMLVCPTISLFI